MTHSAPSFVIFHPSAVHT